MYGNEIKKARKLYGATQFEVSKETGLPQNTISWIELDKGIPNIQQCVLLAQLYGITVDELIGLSDYNADNSNLPAQAQTNLSEFDTEFKDILNDKNFIQTARLFNAIAPELRALTFGYIVGLLQSQGINTQQILNY